ncbi:TPA: helix-turn-helix domain-containing protein [Photobacterium damselae]
MFGQSLSNFRKKHNLTQQQFIEDLVHHDGDFIKLDTVTLSRWENNRTEPPLRKRMIIMNFIKKVHDYINSINYLNDNKVVDSFIKNKFENSSIIITDTLALDYEDARIITNDIKWLNADILIDKYLSDSKFSADLNYNIIAFSRNNQTKSILFYSEDKKSNNLIFSLLSDTLKGFKLLFVELMSVIIESSCDNVVLYSFDKYDNDFWKSTTNSEIQYMKISDNIVRNELVTTKIDFLSNRYFIDLYIKSRG